MGTTIDSLDIQIKTQAGKSVNKIKKLADALEDLRNRSGIGEVTSQLEKLANTLEKINGSSGKLNGLRKITTTMKSASSATGDMGKSTKDLGNGLNTTSLNIMSVVSNLQTFVGAVQSVIQTISGFMAQAIEWDGIQFRFGRAFGEDAEETYQYILKINEALGINIQEFMQYSSLYGSLLSGFGMAQEKVTTISVGLTELSYDIWAAYNDRFKSLEDASEAVRSAITGEIEPIRNAGIALTEASLQEFIDSTHLAGVSIEKLTEAQKAEVRYAAMVDAAMNQGIVGTYAREMQTAEGAIRSLSQSLKTLYQSVGSLFIPLLQTIVPYVTAFVELLTDAVHWLAALFGIEMFKIDWSDTSKGLGDMAEGAADTGTGLGKAADAAKKLKSYTMGFDELNVIDPNAGSSGSGGAGGGAGADGWGSGLDLDTLWDDSVFANASKQVDELKQKIRDFIEEHKILLSVVGAVTAFLGFMKVLRGLNSLLGISKTIANLSAAFTGLKVAAKGIKEFFQNSKMVSSVVGWLKNMFPGASTILSTASAWVTGTFIPAMKTAWTKIPSLLASAVRLLPWVAVITAIAGAIALAVVDYDFTDIGYKIGYALGTACKKIGEWLGKAGEWVVDVGKGILKGINAAWEWVKKEFDINNVFELIILMFNPVAWINKIIPKMIEIGKEVLPGLWKGIKNGWNNFWGNIEELIDGFVQGFKDALGIASPSKVFTEIGEWIVQGLLNGISDRWKAVKQWFTTTVAPKFTKEYWRDKYDAIVAATKEKLDEVKKFLGEKWNAITGWFKENVAPKFTKEYWLTKFDVLRSAIGTKLDEFKKVVSDKWTNLRSWWNSNVAPKLTLSFWLDKFVNLKNGFTQTIKNMVNSGIDIMNKFIGWLNDRMEFSWDSIEIAGKTIVDAGSIQLFTIPKIPKFADGGFLEDGLFTMNHGEIAGKFSNGKSVVANNEQIVAGISKGVYEAVVAAMGENQSGGQAVNVYLDGKQIYSSVKKAESRRGRTLMGNQLGYSY